MDPSKVVEKLRDIASYIESGHVTKKQAAGAIQQVIVAIDGDGDGPDGPDETNKSGKAYRIILDEPLGFTIGFKPEVNQKEGYYGPMETDEYSIISDDGGDFVYIDDEGGGVILSKESSINSEFPEPDQLIFRTPESFSEWYDEYFGDEQD